MKKSAKKKHALPNMSLLVAAQALQVDEGFNNHSSQSVVAFEFASIALFAFFEFSVRPQHQCSLVMVRKEGAFHRELSETLKWKKEHVCQTRPIFWVYLWEKVPTFSLQKFQLSEETPASEQDEFAKIQT